MLRMPTFPTQRRRKTQFLCYSQLSLRFTLSLLLILVLTYEVPGTSGMRRYRFSQRSSSTPAPPPASTPAPLYPVLGKFSWNGMEKGTLPHSSSLGIRPLQSQGFRGGALGAEARQSLTQATSTELQAIRQRTGALLTHRVVIGRMLADRKSAILMIYSNTHYSQSIFTQR